MCIYQSQNDILIYVVTSTLSVESSVMQHGVQGFTEITDVPGTGGQYLEQSSDGLCL